MLLKNCPLKYVTVWKRHLTNTDIKMRFFKRRNLYTLERRVDKLVSKRKKKKKEFIELLYFYFLSFFFFKFVTKLQSGLLHGNLFNS